MREKYSALIQNLLQRKISLEAYQCFLKYQENTLFRKLTESLKQQQIDLKTYQVFLELLQEVLSRKEPISVTEASENNKNKELLEAIGIKLLEEKKLDLSELNGILNSFQKRPFSLDGFLQELLKKRKIKIEDFIALRLGNCEPLSEEETQYRLKPLNTGGFEFYLLSSESNQQFGKYEILEELGRGGMGIVYKAYHPDLKRIVALKVLRARNQATETSKKRFLQEVKTLAKLEHPGIIQILDSGEEEGELYYVMEYVDGVPFSEKEIKTYPIREKVIFIQKTLEALSYVHQQGMIHRDIKLDNIFRTNTGEPKLGDFGLAKELHLEQESSEKLTQSGVLLGTPQYMAPEQARGDLEGIDERSDLYALGVCLYKLMTRNYPHEGGTLHQLLDKILSEEPKIPSKWNSDIHKDLDAIVLKSLEKEPSKRYQSALDFGADLERFLNGYPVQARETS
ncbi:MAG: serine/threonine-protein kinase, partial [Planctomycetota bacterium]